jgi:hypothetical protein
LRVELADKVEVYRTVPPAAPSGMSLPMDAVERLPLALSHLDGWVESLLALLRYVPIASRSDGANGRYPTSRPVPVPIAQIVAAGLRCLNLTLDTPVCPSFATWLISRRCHTSRLNTGHL